MKNLLTALLLLITCSVSAQKAFEYQYYYAKTKNFKVKLSLADGYMPATEIEITSIKTQQTTKFQSDAGQPAANGRMTFYPVSPNKTRKRDNIVLFGIKDVFDTLPQKIKGTYHLDLASYNLVLYKR